MNRELINKLKKFIKENPPLDENGKPEWWSESSWEENLSKEIPNWKDILKSPDVWKEIRGVRPRRDYDDLLAVILQYAPPEILKEYLTSDDPEERKVAYKILTQDNGQRLTSRFWKLLDYDTKIWIISKIFKETIDKSIYLGFLRDLEYLLYDPDYFLERLRRRYKVASWVYPHIITLAFIGAILYEYEGIDTSHPLWIKLKAIIEESNDLASMRKIEEIERKIEKKIQLINDKLKVLFPALQYIYQHEYPSVSKNVLFDPSLLLDSEKARKVFSFMKEYYEDFNFFIPASFYNILRENLNKIVKIVEFFNQERNISPRELLRMLEEHRRYYKIFEIPERFYYEKYRYFYENLREEVEDRILAEILFEEWVFLQEFSWIVAKSKKTFEKFKEAGAVAIEISKNAFDKIIEKLARHKLNKKDDEILSTAEKLRGLGKWIAHGGITVISASVIDPIWAAAIGYLSSELVFVMIDPEDYLSLET